jgi:hypothetical protein
MKFTLPILSVLLTSLLAFPVDYTPHGGWSSIDWSKVSYPKLPSYPPPVGGWGTVDWSKVSYPKLPSYPAPPGGWSSVTYPPGTGAKPCHCSKAAKREAEPKDYTPVGGWGSVDWSKVKYTAAKASAGVAASCKC